MSEGIQGYSTPTPEHVIFCVDPNKRELFETYLEVSKLNAHVIRFWGSYECEVEPSFALPKDWFEYMQGCTHGLFLQQQESVLHLGFPKSCNWRPATLQYLADGKSTYIGNFIEVSKEQAMKEKGWTSSLDGEHYWICSEETARSQGEAYSNAANKLHRHLRDNPEFIARIQRNLQSDEIWVNSPEVKRCWELIINFHDQKGGYGAARSTNEVN